MDNLRTIFISFKNVLILWLYLWRYFKKCTRWYTEIKERLVDFILFSGQANIANLNLWRVSIYNHLTWRLVGLPDHCNVIFTVRVHRTGEVISNEVVINLNVSEFQHSFFYHGPCTIMRAEVFPITSNGNIGNTLTHSVEMGNTFNIYTLISW